MVYYIESESEVNPRMELSQPHRILKRFTAEGFMQDEMRFGPLLGCAAIHLWAELPREVQEKLFEHAVVIGHKSERDESLREQLAKFLHDRHARTQIA